jgi:hypothetical protein
MRTKLLLFIFIAALSTMAQARPAPWYWWASSVSEARVCTQTSPGKAWLREPQAFRDAQCSVRLESWLR